MRKLPSLVRTALRSNFGLSVLRHRIVREKKDLWLVPLFALAGIGLLPALYGLVLLLENMFLLLQPMGQERALLTLGVLTGQMLIMVFGLYYVVSAFYFSRDLDMLVPLPLKPYQVMASKFAVVLANEYLTVVVIVLPVLGVFGVLARGGIGYWVNAALVFLLLPVIPLAAVSILVVAMMRVVNFSRKKDALILIGSMFLISASVALQFVLRRGGDAKIDAQAAAAFLASPDSLLNRVGAGFPPSAWAAKAMAGGFTGEGLWNLFLFAGTSLVLLAAMLVLSERLFYRGLIGIGEISARRRALTADQMSQRLSSGRHPVRAIFLREWRIMNRTPIFFLNGILVVLLVPVLMIVMSTMGSGRGNTAAFLKMFTAANPLAVILASAAFMTLCGSLNGTASSTFSREGAQFWISRVIPVAARDQTAAKFLHSFVIASLGIITATVVLGIFFHIPPVSLAAAVALAGAAAVPLTAGGMIIDLARPLLDWTNPQKAIKQNVNVLLAMIADVVFLTALFFFLRLLSAAGVRDAAQLVLLLALLIGLGVGGWRFLLWFADQRYPAIE